jgi:hypothetical protein
VASLKSLQSVTLDHTSVDDHGLELLKNLPLQELRLDATSVTDAGVDSLASFTNLKFLNIYHTTVSQQAFDKLKAAIPSCKVVWDRDSGLPNRRKG